jgi:hypothetical protein
LRLLGRATTDASWSVGNRLRIVSDGEDERFKELVSRERAIGRLGGGLVRLGLIITGVPLGEKRGLDAVYNVGKVDGECSVGS